MTVADHCYSIGLISQYTYDQLRERKDLIDEDRARTLLDNIRRVFSSRPSALKEFVTVLFQTGECNHVADKLQQQLQYVYYHYCSISISYCIVCIIEMKLEV